MSIDTLKYPDVAAHWDHFARVDIPAGAPPIQREEMERAFMAGVSSGVALIVAMLDKGDGIPREVWERVAAVNAELGAWAATRRARRGRLPPDVEPEGQIP
jgi:hypothetical protein